MRSLVKVLVTISLVICQAALAKRDAKPVEQEKRSERQLRSAKAPAEKFRDVLKGLRTAKSQDKQLSERERFDLETDIRSISVGIESFKSVDQNFARDLDSLSEAMLKLNDKAMQDPSVATMVDTVNKKLPDAISALGSWATILKKAQDSSPRETENIQLAKATLVAISSSVTMIENSLTGKGELDAARSMIDLVVNAKVADIQDIIDVGVKVAGLTKEGKEENIEQTAQQKRSTLRDILEKISKNCKKV